MSTTNTSSSVFDKTYNPIVQALVALGAVMLFIVFAKLIKLSGLMYVPDRFPWMTAASFLLLFAMGNSVFSLSADNMLKYWGRSVYSYLGLAVGSGVLAYFTSSMSIDEAGSYRWIYLVLTVGYLVFLGMMAFMRQIVDFAQREEWNHPRIRRGKNKNQKNRKK